MANAPWDREVINTRERPLSSDINMVESYSDQEVRNFVQAVYATRSPAFSNNHAVDNPPTGTSAVPTIGCIGSALQVRNPALPVMDVQMDSGLAFMNDGTPTTSVGGVSGLNDVSPIKPVVLVLPLPQSAPLFTGINPGGGTARVDLVEIKLPRRFLDPTSRDILNPTSGAFTPQLVNKTLSYVLDQSQATTGGSGVLNYKMGVPTVGAIYPTLGVPTPDPGYVALAYINVGPADTQIGALNIVDVRRQLYAGGVMTCAFSANIQSTGPTTATATMTSVVGPPGVLINVSAPTRPTTGVNGSTSFNINVVAACAFTTRAVIELSFASNIAILTDTLRNNYGVNQVAVTSGIQTELNAVTSSPQIAVGQGTTIWRANVTVQCGDAALVGVGGTISILQG
jgi:xanthosine utilization system XapX-like protein